MGLLACFGVIVHPPFGRWGEQTRLGSLMKRLAVSLGLVVAALAASLTLRPAGAVTIAEKRAEAAEISARLAGLDEQAMRINGQYETANYELLQLQEKIAATRAYMEQTRREADTARTEVRTYAINAYSNGDRDSTIDVVLSSEPGTGVQRQMYLETLSGNRQDLIDRLRAAEQRAGEDEKALAVLERDAQGKVDQIAELKRSADAAAAEVRALNNRVQGELRALVEEENRRRAEAAARAAAGRGFTGVVNNNAPNPGGGAAGAIAAGRTKIGAGYSWGAAGPDVFDCSGFVMWAYRQVGISLPHYSGAMYRSTVRIAQSQLQPGDLVFWDPQGWSGEPSGSQHVAIYIGGGQVIHTANGVNITSMIGWWSSNPPSGYGRIAAR